MTWYAIRHPEAGPTSVRNWTISTNPFCEGWITDSGASYYGLSHPEALRAVACINAMAGIPDPAAFVERARRIGEAADHADMQAWNLMAHEYGEHFRVSDSDTSKWADKVRAFLAASSALRTALETNP